MSGGAITGGNTWSTSETADLQDVTLMTFAYTAGTWIWDVGLLTWSSTTGLGALFGVTTTDTAHADSQWNAFGADAATAGHVTAAVEYRFDTALSRAFGSYTASTYAGVRIWGWLTATTSGTFKLRCKASATGTIYLKYGGMIQAQKIA
jgi:hypothetical protein